MEPVVPTVDDNEDEAATLSKLQATRANLIALLTASSELAKDLSSVNNRMSVGLETVAAASDAVAPLQAQSIAAKALHSRINRAVSPALSVINSFSLVESLQHRLLSLSDDDNTKLGLGRLLKYVDCVDRLNVGIESVTTECEPAIQRLQEAVEFLSRTKATDQLRIHRLRETLGAIKALYQTELDAMRYEGSLDEALLRLQDEFEGVLQQIKHKGIGELDGESLQEVVEDLVQAKVVQLGSDLEVEVLGRISETLAANDCLDICIDIYVKVRYRRAAKALMRLNPRYLKTFAPEDIDKMEWEGLESSITLWIEHFQLAVKVVFVSEKQLCKQVLSGVLDGAIWPECFVKIADKIMAVFFRFGEGVARSSKEPQKLFKLLDMYDSMDKIRTEFFQVFDGESGIDICARFRELQKLLVHAASKVFWEFGLQIEGLQDAAPPPPDGSVPKIVRYAVNYLKCLAASGYAATMGQVLRTEQMWKSAGFLSRPEPDESLLLREAVSNALDALMRNVEYSKRSKYYNKDKVVPHVLAMNSYWYMYMRTRGSDLAKLIGEDVMKKKYKTAAEKAAYSYQAEAWGTLVKLLERDEELVVVEQAGHEVGVGAVARGKMEVFMREFEDTLRRHRSWYSIPDLDLREQMKEAVEKVILPAYAGFVHAYSGVIMQGRSFLPPDSIRELLGRLFDDGGGAGGGGREGARKSSVVESASGKVRYTDSGDMRRHKQLVDKVQAGGDLEISVRRGGGGSFGRREEVQGVGGRFGEKEGLITIRSFALREGGGGSSFGKREEKEVIQTFQRKETSGEEIFGPRREVTATEREGGEIRGLIERREVEEEEEERAVVSLGLGRRDIHDQIQEERVDENGGVNMLGQRIRKFNNQRKDKDDKLQITRTMESSERVNYFRRREFKSQKHEVGSTGGDAEEQERGGGRRKMEMVEATGTTYIRRREFKSLGKGRQL